MKAEVMANMDAALTWLPVAALFIFLIVFVGVLIWSYRKGSDKVYDQVSHSALDEGTRIKNTGAN